MHCTAFRVFSFALLGIATVTTAFAQQYQPEIAAASKEAELAIGGFVIPRGMTAEVWAAEPLLANPVAFKLDERGRAFVCETFRQQRGVEDNRYHMAWLLDDLAATSLADRLAYFKKHLGPQLADYSKHHDRIRLVADTDGDGTADASTVFADGFNGPLDGTGAGVLACGGNVYYTCIPHLWQLQDDDGDGIADRRTSLDEGFGVRVAFRGHDMHGLIVGPDGRLYFSIGDRGYNVTTADGRHLFRPYCGAVFRCDLDGSNLEEYAYGLRNPQELAFDDYGNLFTGDNNSDSGDQSRWVYVMPGGDCGWRMYYQYLEDRGPWNREKLWHPPHAGQAAYIVPPVANIADGPAGLIHYPGVGLAERYRGHFFLCDFRGTVNQSGVRSFAVKPHGAGFELVDSHRFIWQILCTDIDFDAAGRIYVSDWVHGWEGVGKGRIYRFEDAKAVAASHRSIAKSVVKRLEDPDQRVRQQAQFALVEQKAVDELESVAIDGKHQLARIHAIWGLGQLGRQDHGHVLGIVPLLQDADAEIRAQVAKVLGDVEPLDGVEEKLIERLADESARVRSFAALTLGQWKSQAAVEPLLKVAEENNDRDPWLRHAVVKALADINAPAELMASQNRPASVRRVILLALRRLKRPEVAGFLADEDPSLVLEAARAIHDEPIADALPALGELASSDLLKTDSDDGDALARRVANANFRAGHGAALVEMGRRTDIPERYRLYALQALADWNEPSPLDRVLNDYRPLAKHRPTKDFAPLLEASIAELLSDTEAIRATAVQLVKAFHLESAQTDLVRIVRSGQPTELRVAALRAAAEFKNAEAAAIVDEMCSDKVPQIRLAALQLLAKDHPDRALESLPKILATGTLSEQQAAVEILTEQTGAKADAMLLKWFDRMLAGTAPAGLQLDLIEAAAAKRDDARFAERLAQFDKQRPADPLGNWHECLEGGDPARGKAIMFGRSDASCRRCHKVGDEGGDVGPNLTTVANDKSREYLLESIVFPNAKIAKGFETNVIITTEGKIEVGIVRQETDAGITLMKADGEMIVIAKDEIDERDPGQSSMPELVKFLSKQDLRDLVEYLSSLKQPSEEPGGER